jgi:acylphosphatase
MRLSRRLFVHGRVQGVFYRAWSAEQARSLGLKGWVRNRRDGSVELLVEGEETSVEKMIARCREGPPAAAVERIDVGESDEPAPPGFETRPTA